MSGQLDKMMGTVSNTIETDKLLVSKLLVKHNFVLIVTT